MCMCVYTQAHTETHIHRESPVSLEQRMTEHLETSSPGLASALYPQLTLVSIAGFNLSLLMPNTNLEKMQKYIC